MVYLLFNIENPVMSTTSVFNNFAGNDCELFWSTGVLECWKKQKPEFILSESFHYSITPSLHHSSRLPQEGKDHSKPLRGHPKPSSFGPGYFIFAKHKKGLVFFLIYLYPTCITNEA